MVALDHHAQSIDCDQWKTELVLTWVHGPIGLENVLQYPDEGVEYED